MTILISSIITAMATLLAALITKYGIPIPFIFKKYKLNGRVIPLYFIDKKGIKSEYGGLSLSQEITDVSLKIVGSNVFCKGTFLMKENDNIQFLGKLKAKGKVDKDIVFMVYTVTDKKRGDFSGVVSMNFNVWVKPTCFYNAKSYVDKNKIVFGKIEIQILDIK